MVSRALIILASATAFCQYAVASPVIEQATVLADGTSFQHGSLNDGSGLKWQAAG